jgi:peroxiredoxin
VPRVGDKAPEFTLTAAMGEPVSLYRTLETGRNVLLVFLRHLG